MNVNKIIWLGSLSLLSAHSSAFISRMAVVIPELRVTYVVGVLGAVWFFKGQWDGGFRGAIANLLNIDEGEYVVIIFFVLTGVLIGVIPTWINTIQ